MATTSALALILAGGASPALSVLTALRSEAALPFGGKFRIIDFPLSNCVNSDIYDVGVLTQYQPVTGAKRHRCPCWPVCYGFALAFLQSV